MKEIKNNCGSFLVDDQGVLLDFKCAGDNIHQPGAVPHPRDEKHVNYLTIPEGVTALPAGAFDGYSVFEGLTLPQSLRRIGEENGGAFRYGYFLKAELSKNLEFLAPDSFFGSFIVEIKLPKGMDSRIFQECIDQFNHHTAYHYFFSSVERVRNSPASGHRIRELKNECGSFFVNECGDLLRFVCAPENNAADVPPEETRDIYNLRIPEGVTMLPYGAFEEYTVRLLLTLPDSLVILGTGNGNAFAGSRLPGVHIPQKLRFLGIYAFGSSDIRELWLPRKLPTWVYARQFKEAHIGRLHLPADSEFDEYDRLFILRQNNVTIGEIVKDGV